jgi:hypothetical protein
MSRKVLDKLASGAGIVLVVVLLIAGGLMAWGASFANSNVHNQLAMQQVFFPTKAELAHPNGGEITGSMQRYLGRYAGQQVLSGPQAEAYANHFIAVHLSEMPYGGVYSKVSGAAITHPSDTALAAEKTTTFMGTTLRGLLLEAYAFWTIGQILMWGAIAAFGGALLMALLVGLGIWHARRTSEEEQVLVHSSDAVATA